MKYACYHQPVLSSTSFQLHRTSPRQLVCPNVFRHSDLLLFVHVDLPSREYVFFWLFQHTMKVQYFFDTFQFLFCRVHPHVTSCLCVFSALFLLDGLDDWYPLSLISHPSPGDLIVSPLSLSVFLFCSWCHWFCSLCFFVFFYSILRFQPVTVPRFSAAPRVSSFWSQWLSGLSWVFVFFFSSLLNSPLPAFVACILDFGFQLC